MKIIALLMLFACSQVFASVFAQNLTIKAEKQPLKYIFRVIEQQSEYRFMYKEADLKNIPTSFSLNVKNATIRQTLKILLDGQPLSYEFVEKTIFIKANPKAIPNKSLSKQKTLTGLVVDEKGNPLTGATVKVKGTNQNAATNNEGEYTLSNVPDDAVLIISYIGYLTQEVSLKNASKIILSKNESKLDEIQVIAYGTTTKRLNTGSVGTMPGSEIAKQPVSNPLAALSGRIPGLVVNQSTGVPGSSFNIQIRGRNSIAQGSQPLILIDGIPFATGNEGISFIPSALTAAGTASLSPFNSINPSDIESIEILKDADATAIYGSRGANGIVLITTRKGKAGKTQITANINQGFTQVGKTIELMNTEQYLEMRKEAFVNSNITPTVTNAPDILAWDQNRYTDYKKELIGGTGKLTNAQLSLSGGSSEIQYLVGGAFYRETSVFPNALPNTRGSVNMNLNHTTKDKRFNISLSSSFTAGENRTAGEDLTRYTFLSPNTPAFFTTDGKLKWVENGAQYENPYRYLYQVYNVKTNNLLSSLNTSYKILDNLTIKLAMGYNQLNGKEKKLSPISSLAPNQTQVNTSNFANSEYNSWNIEPQVEYDRQMWKGKLNILFGGTFQQKKSYGYSVTASGFSTETLMESLQAASNISGISNSFTHYKYQAVFARANYNIENKYLINLTARRDGSSRFGTGKQFANFGAVGAAWIFTEENWLKYKPSFLSFGKLRGSYGITGNDQIGDYQFLDTWQAGIQTYEGIPTLVPTALANADYSWEVNKKFEAALDLGFFNDRILLSTNYYRNRSNNQLVAYKLPNTTGFPSIIRNFPALVQNHGWEFTANADIIRSNKFNWSISVNATIPRNKLLEFPGIETSTYGSIYKVGESLNSIYRYQYTGINQTTGLYSFNDINGDGNYSYRDYVVNGTLDPKIYGGLNNTFSYKGIEISIFFDYKQQKGKNFLNSIYTNSLVPGLLWNQPEILLDRWRNNNSDAEYEKYVATIGSSTANIYLSDRVYGDASYIRLRNLSLSYTLPVQISSKFYSTNARIYAQGQNLFTWNRAQGFDPETQNLYALPPLRVYSFGIQLTF